MLQFRCYVFAVALCGGAIAVAWPLDAPVSCLFLAVILSSFYGGRGPAILAALLSSVAFEYLFLPPRFSFAIREASYARLAVFLVSLVLVTWLVETRRTKEQAYRRIGEQHRLVAETAMDGIVSVDMRGNVTFANPAAARMFSRDEKEILGKPVTEIIPDFRTHDCQGLKDLLGLRKNGERFPIEVSFGEITTRWEQVFTGFVRDMTERRRAEEELRQSEAIAEARLRLVVDTTPAMLHTAKPDGSMDYINKGWQDYLGLPLEAVSGAKWESVIHPDDVARVHEVRRAKIVSGRAAEYEARIRRHDGAYRWFWLRTVPLHDKQGNVARWFGATFDIEDRKRAEEALRRNEAYLAEAQRLTKSGSWAWNVRSGELYWSDEIYRIYELDPKSVRPDYSMFLDRVHSEDRPSIERRREMETVEKDWKDSQAEFRIILPGGKIKWLHSIANPALDGAGEIIEIVGTVTDITERKRAEDELRKAFEEIRKLKDRLSEENIALREEIDQASLFEEIVGSSAALRGVLSQVAKVAPTDSTVLITGETGTGKELVARAIHNRSHRAGAPFIRINCAVIPQSLIASELFGHEKGAFTGATQRRIGRFELAHRGTILLDEVGELPADAQVALLRVLQEREIERVGGRQPIAVDVRVLAATNRDLHAMTETGTFRRDLFYRLNVFPIQTPPLRERIEDIPLLVEYLIERYAGKAGKRIKSVGRSTLELLQNYDWPGNIRELQNVVERAVVLSNSDTFHVDEAWLRGESPRRQDKPLHDSPWRRVDQNREKELIENALADTGGRIAGPRGAAAKLGIPRQTLDSKIRSLGINKHRFKP